MFRLNVQPDGSLVVLSEEASSPSRGSKRLLSITSPPLQQLATTVKLCTAGTMIAGKRLPTAPWKQQHTPRTEMDDEEGDENSSNGMDDDKHRMVMDEVDETRSFQYSARVRPED